MDRTLPLTEAKAKLSEVVAEVSERQDRVVLTRNGRPAAVLVNPDDLESLEETIAILSDPDLMTRLRQGLAEADSGEGQTIEEILAERRDVG